MNTWTLSVSVLLSLAACQSSTPTERPSAPAVTPTSGGSAAADAGVAPAPAAPDCGSATACDACLAVAGCNWTGDRCSASCLMDTSCFGPGNPSAAQCPTAAPPAPVNALVGVRSLAFRAGARPPVGALGAHGATVWAVTLAASAGSSPELTALFQQTQAAHLASSVGELSCTPAVGDAYPSTIPGGEGAQALTVTFRSERDARQFAAALVETPLRVGRVRVMCAD